MQNIKASPALIAMIRRVPAHKRVEAARFAEKKLNEFYAIETRVPCTRDTAIAHAMLAVEAEIAYTYGLK